MLLKDYKRFVSFDYTSFLKLGRRRVRSGGLFFQIKGIVFFLGNGRVRRSSGRRLRVVPVGGVNHGPEHTSNGQQYSQHSQGDLAPRGDVAAGGAIFFLRKSFTGGHSCFGFLLKKE